MPTGPKNGKSRSFTLRLPMDLDALVRKISEERGVSVSQIVIAALREFLTKEDVAE